MSHEDNRAATRKSNKDLSLWSLRPGCESVCVELL
jgi:hypothetical protein